MINSKNPQKRSAISHQRVLRHSSFRAIQIKPLTEEEKKQKLAELREKMAAKRAAKAIEDAKEAKANEAIRRKSGKVSASSPSTLTIAGLGEVSGYESTKGRT